MFLFSLCNHNPAIFFSAYPTQGAWSISEGTQDTLEAVPTKSHIADNSELPVSLQRKLGLGEETRVVTKMSR